MISKQFYMFNVKPINCFVLIIVKSKNVTLISSSVTLNKINLLLDNYNFLKAKI